MEATSGQSASLSIMLRRSTVAWLWSTSLVLIAASVLFIVLLVPRQLGVASPADDAREAHLYRCLVGVLLRWLAGVVVAFSAAGAVPASPTPTAAGTAADALAATTANGTVATTASSLPCAPFNFVASTSFVFCLRNVQRRMSRPDRQILHARLKLVYDICTAHSINQAKKA